MTYKNYEDNILVEKTLTGDYEAYSEIVTRYKNLVFSVSMSIIHNYHTAEDIAQETFINGFLKLNTLSDHSKVAAWLCRIAKNKSYNYTSRNYQMENLDVLEYTPDSNNLLELLIRKDIKEEVSKAIHNLSEKNQEVVNLYYKKDYSQVQIANLLNIPLGTVKRRLHESRIKLKKELEYMKEEHVLTSDFEKKVKEKIKQLEEYYRLNNFSYEGFDLAYEETLRLVNKLPESKDKKNAYASVYLCAYYRTPHDKSLIEKVISNAKEGNNADALCTIMVEKAISFNNDDEAINFYDNEAIPTMQSMHYDDGIGILLFWKGRSLLSKSRENEAIECFNKAKQLLKKENIYYANTLAALNGISYLNEHAEGLNTSYLCFCGESFEITDQRIVFTGQPGFSINFVHHRNHNYSSILYHLSICDNITIDYSLKVGELIKCKNNGSTLTLVADNETIDGFNNCMHFKVKENHTADFWFSKDIGPVKVIFEEQTGYSETYELYEYKIEGGNGYFPIHEGNVWRYRNKDIGNHFYQCVEKKIISYNGKFANVSSIDIFGYKKIGLDDVKHDSDYYISKAEFYCNSWKISEAIDCLKLAVQSNTTNSSTLMAMHGINYLSRYKTYVDKNYRICPSSINGSQISKKDGKVVYNEATLYSFGVYRFGTRHEENKIFGMKPFRYLQQLTNCIFNENWVEGYKEEKQIEEGIKLSITVENGGTVNVKAGSFTNCLKVTLIAEKDNSNGLYYFDNFSYVYCGTKEYWYAPNVGIVRHDCTWGNSLYSRCELSEYSNVATSDEYMPVYCGSKWVYDETTLEKGYRARCTYTIPSGIIDEFFLIHEQEFLYLGTEKEYEDMKANI